MGQKCLNRWQGIGFVGKTPELRRTPKGISVCNVNLACGRSWKDSAGDKQERTDWIPIVAWDKLADLVSQYVKVGDLIEAEGTLQFTEKERDGAKYQQGEIVLTDIIFLRSKVPYDGGQEPERREPPRTSARTPDYRRPAVDDSGIPF